MLFTISCSKDGAAGPKGDTGDKGSIGAVGPAGPAGANGAAGSIIYSGTTVPPATKGVVGDYYLNISTSLLYGPKTAAGWGDGNLLKSATGATGATGAAGSTTLSGAGTPAPGLGKNGDYYLDKTNYLLYGPKTAAGWGLPINLQGPQGNANVTVDLFTIKTTDWSYTDKNNKVYYYNVKTGGTDNNIDNMSHDAKAVDVNNSLLTAGLLNTGLVLVYFQANPDDNAVQWQPLPFSIPTIGNSPDYNCNWAYETFVGKVRLYFYLTKITVDPPYVKDYQVPTTRFKIVMVPESMEIQLVKSHINVNKYEEVSRFLNIK